MSSPRASVASSFFGQHDSKLSLSTNAAMQLPQSVSDALKGIKPVHLWLGDFKTAFPYSMNYTMRYDITYQEVQQSSAPLYLHFIDHYRGCYRIGNLPHLDKITTESFLTFLREASNLKGISMPLYSLSIPAFMFANEASKENNKQAFAKMVAAIAANPNIVSLDFPRIYLDTNFSDDSDSVYTGIEAVVTAKKSIDSLRLDLKRLDKAPAPIFLTKVISCVKKYLSIECGQLWEDFSLTTDHIAAIEAAISDQLVRLNISNCSEIDVRAFNKVLEKLAHKECKLEMLSLSCGLTDESIPALINLIQSAPSLHYLYLDGNKFTKIGMQLLSQALQNVTHTMEISLGRVPVCKEMVTCLTNNPNIIKFNVDVPELKDSLSFVNEPDDEPDPDLASNPEFLAEFQAEVKAVAKAKAEAKERIDAVFDAKQVKHLAAKNFLQYEDAKLVYRAIDNLRFFPPEVANIIYKLEHYPHESYQIEKYIAVKNHIVYLLEEFCKRTNENQGYLRSEIWFAIRLIGGYDGEHHFKHALYQEGRGEWGEIISEAERIPVPIILFAERDKFFRELRETLDDKNPAKYGLTADQKKELHAIYNEIDRCFKTYVDKPLFPKTLQDAKEVDMQSSAAAGKLTMK